MKRGYLGAKDIPVSAGAKGMGTQLTIPISGPRPSPKENCMPSCRKKAWNTHTSSMAHSGSPNSNLHQGFLFGALPPFVLVALAGSLFWGRFASLLYRTVGSTCLSLWQTCKRDTLGQSVGPPSTNRKPTVINKLTNPTTPSLLSRICTYSVNARPTVHKCKPVSQSTREKTRKIHY